jgi:hypothetical protein
LHQRALSLPYCRNPADPDDPEIGDKPAVSHALSDSTHQ